MQRLEFSGAVRPLQWSLGVKGLSDILRTSAISPLPQVQTSRHSAHKYPSRSDTWTHYTLSVPLELSTQAFRFISDFCMVYVQALQQHQPTPVNKSSIEWQLGRSGNATSVYKVVVVSSDVIILWLRKITAVVTKSRQAAYRPKFELWNLNLYTPNVNYSWRTAPLTSKVAFYIFIQQI